MTRTSKIFISIMIFLPVIVMVLAVFRTGEYSDTTVTLTPTNPLDKAFYKTCEVIGLTTKNGNAYTANKYVTNVNECFKMYALVSFIEVMYNFVLLPVNWGNKLLMRKSDL